jgi:hypothetical protein
MGEDPQAIRQEIEHTRERMGETADALAYRANIKARTKDRISGTGRSIGATVTGARDRLGLSASQITAAAPSASDVREGAQRAVGVAQENPLGLALGSVAIGFVIGLFVPTTKIEEERLAPIADEVKAQALQTGQEAVEHAKEIAQDAAAGAAAAAQASSQEHAQALKESAQESVEHVKETAPSPGS